MLLEHFFIGLSGIASFGEWSWAREDSLERMFDAGDFWGLSYNRLVNVTLLQKYWNKIYSSSGVCFTCSRRFSFPCGFMGSHPWLFVPHP